MNHTNAREVAELAAKIIAPTFVVAPSAPFLKGWVDMKEALEWYEKKCRFCNKYGEVGDAARDALTKDSGKRARLALEKVRDKKCE